MADVTITLTDDQVKAFEDMGSTPELVARGIANDHIRQKYDTAFEAKDLAEKKALLPDIKIKEPEDVS